MENIFLLLGSNLGARTEHLRHAILELGNGVGTITTTSSVFETEPWGKQGQFYFLNQAVAIQTDLNPMDLLGSLISIEEKMGRVRTEKHGDRIIDLDILLYGNEIVKTKALTIPHPYLHLRKFALTPLAEIAPRQVHPALNKSIRQLLQECKDDLLVTQYP